MKLNLKTLITTLGIVVCFVYKSEGKSDKSTFKNVQV